MSFARFSRFSLSRRILWFIFVSDKNLINIKYLSIFFSSSSSFSDFFFDELDADLLLSFTILLSRDFGESLVFDFLRKYNYKFCSIIKGETYFDLDGDLTFLTTPRLSPAFSTNICALLSSDSELSRWYFKILILIDFIAYLNHLWYHPETRQFRFHSSLRRFQTQRG